MTKSNLHKHINSLRLPKRVMLLIGIPYTTLLCFITWITYNAEAFIMMLGFGIISIIMIGILIGYCYHLFLITTVSHTEKIIEVQKSIAELKISSFNIARLAVLQLPFWAICWVSIDALMKSPILYGGINLAVILGLSYISYRLYQGLSIDNPNSKISRLILSGSEWEPLIKSSEILEQLKKYEK